MIMNDHKIENVVGALALTLSDILLEASQSEAPDNVTAAGLTLVGHVPGLSIHELSHGLSLSHPGTVRLVDRMVAENLMERRPSKEDGRAVALFLTPKGKRRERKILLSRRDALGNVLSLLSRDERQMLAQISEKIITTILKGEEHALRICRLCDEGACVDCPVDAELERKSQAENRLELSQHE